VTALGLVLAIAGAVAINGGYALQHGAAASMTPLSLRRPLRSLVLLFRSGRWSAGFFAGIGGWVLYVAALRLAPLSLVQAASAGGIGVLALGLGRLRPGERVGVGAAMAGLVLLGLSLAAHAPTGRGSAAAAVAWVASSGIAAALAARLLPAGAGLGTAAGVLYAAGDVATKAAVEGRLWFVPVLLACHGLAFVALQLAFQRGGRLTTAGLAVLWTNALPILAGMVLFGEAWGGPARVAAFALVLVGAVALSRVEPGPSRRPPSPPPHPAAQPPAPRPYAARESGPT
jgi:hypothetical protein